jgi:hypothetical protein
VNNLQMPNGYVCWTTEGLDMIQSDVGKIMSGDEAIIQAVHQNVDVNVESPEVIARLTAILEPGKSNRDAKIIEIFRSAVEAGQEVGDNVLLSVVGNTGSGKSHIVRWLFQQIDEDESKYIKLWVPRRENAQKFVIKKFIEDLARLGNERAGELKTKLDATFRKSDDQPAELLEDIYVNVARHLRFEVSLREGRTDDERAKRKLLLGEADTESKYGVLWQVLNDVQNEEMQGQVKNGLAVFIREIVESFNQVSEKDENKQVAQSELKSERVEKIFKDYKKLINKKIQDHTRYSNLFDTALLDIEIVTDVLNEAVEFAVNSVMSMDGSSIREVFSEVREELAKHNKQLLIFVEDFSAISGSVAGLGKLQRDLMGMFTESSSNGKLAPLRVAMAITNNTYEILETNFRQRMNFVIRIDDVFKSVAGEPFMASYLRLARSVRSEVVDAWALSKENASESSSWVPNKCVDCKFQAECFETFGSEGGVGLYPLNKAAVNRLSNQGQLNPRARIARLKGLLSTLQADFANEDMPSKGIVGYFGPLKDSQERQADEFKMLRVDFVGLKGQKPEESRDRLRRFLHNWKDGTKPTEIESRVFALPIFDSFMNEDGLTPPGDEPPVVTLGEKSVPKPQSQLQTHLDRINAWREAGDGVDYGQVFTSNLHSLVRNYIVTSVRSAFGRQFAGATLGEYSDKVGLRFVEASIRVDGILSQGVGNENPLSPYFTIPRNEHGANVLRGVLCIEALKNGEKIDSIIPPIQQPVLVNTAVMFIRQIVEELVQIIHKYEVDPQSIWAHAARVIQFERLTNPDFNSVSDVTLINQWLNNAVPQQGVAGELTSANNEFRSCTSDLVKAVEVLTQVTQEEKTSSKGSTYRRLSILRNQLLKVSKQAIENIDGISISVDSNLPWATNLRVGRNRLLESLSKESLEDLKTRVQSDVNAIEESLDEELDSELDWLKKNINSLMIQSAFTVAPPELLKYIEEIEQVSKSKMPELLKVKQVLSNGFDPNEVACVANEIDQVLRIARFRKKLMEELAYAVEKLESKLGVGASMSIPAIIDLELVTTLEGLDEIGVTNE